MPTIDYALLTIFLATGYGLLAYFWPEFPVSREVFDLLILGLLAKVGVDVVGKPAVARVVAFMQTRGFWLPKSVKAVKAKK